MKLLVLFAALLGLAAPAARLTSLDEAGYRKMVASHKGKVLLVNFWATYCLPCRKEMPALVRMHDRLKPKGFDFVTVSADEPEQEADAVEFLTDMKVPAPLYLRRGKSEEAFINSIDPKWSGALPATFLYDKSGRKVKSLFGEVDLKTLEAEIQKLL